MSVRAVLKRVPREVSGRLVKVNEECRLPPELARSLERKGLCVIVAMETRVQPDIEVETKIAKKARTKAKKARADGKKKATSSVVTISDMAGRTSAKKK